MSKPILVSDMASLGGHASAKTRTAAERRAMALRGWARRRAREARQQ